MRVRIVYSGELPRKNTKRRPGVTKKGRPYLYVSQKEKDPKRGLQAAIGWVAKVAMRKQAGGKFFPGKIQVRVVWRFRNPKESDIDGPIETTLDALKKIVYRDDITIRRLVVDIDEQEPTPDEDEAVILVEDLDAQIQMESISRTVAPSK